MAKRKAGQAEHPRHLGRRHRHRESQLLTHGLMGYQTPNIDRLAKEGMLFTDSYGEQSCTAGRSSFITGQSVYRTGLSKVGIPAAPIGMNEKIITIAAALKNQGYTTGQFGKNHLGDLNKMLPTNNGFDEFYGNLYHLNAEEEPELPDYPKAKEFPNFAQDVRPARRHPFLGDRHRRSDRQPRWGKVGKQKITDTGPLDKKAHGDLRRRLRQGSQALHEGGERRRKAVLRLAELHPHACRTHTKPESIGQAGRWQSPYHDTMIDHDKNVGQALDYLDEIGIADNTFVMYSTDNGPHMNTWPDGAMTPFRSEKNTNWEGAFRIPLLVRWPGKIAAGTGLERDRPAPRLVPDLPRHGRRSGRHRETEERLQGDRPHLQEPPRRLQSPALPHRQGEEEPAQSSSCI